MYKRCLRCPASAELCCVPSDSHNPPKQSWRDLCRVHRAYSNPRELPRLSQLRLSWALKPPSSFKTLLWKLRLPWLCGLKRDTFTPLRKGFILHIQEKNKGWRLFSCLSLFFFFFFPFLYLLKVPSRLIAFSLAAGSRERLKCEIWKLFSRFLTTLDRFG